MNIKNLVKKFKLILFILSYENIQSITEEQKIRGIIISELGKGLKIDNVEQHFQINAITDSIVSKMFNKASFEESFKTTVSGVTEQNMWFFSSVAGYAALWELKVKLLAEHLGIEIKEPPDKRSKHHKKNRIMTNRELSSIISDINKKISINFDLRLTNLNALRSSLVHGNFDQLRILANNCKHNYKKEHQGNVFVFSINNPSEGVNLSQNLPQQTREQQNTYSWFLEVTNTHLLREVWRIFEDSIKKITCIVDFGSFSFDERRILYENVLFKGEKLTPQMMDSYQDILRVTPFKTVDTFFGRMNELFGPKIFTEVPVKKN